MDYRRIYAIPDIHGRLDLLDRALELMDEDGYDAKQDMLVFTGDVIDRGPDSKGVVDLIMALMKDNPETVKMVRGNHDDFPVSLYAKMEPYAMENWMHNGMWSTLRSYSNGEDGPFRMSDEHIKFLGSHPYSLEVQGFFFSHAPVPREKARGSSRGQAYTVNELTWSYFGLEGEFPGGLMDCHEGPRSDKGEGDQNLIGVCGHIHRGPMVKEIRVYPNYRMLDCGCGCFPSGRLAIHECISNRTLYADPNDLTEKPRS